MAPNPSLSLYRGKTYNTHSAPSFQLGPSSRFSPYVLTKDRNDKAVSLGALRLGGNQNQRMIMSQDLETICSYISKIVSSDTSGTGLGGNQLSSTSQEIVKFLWNMEQLISDFIQKVEGLRNHSVLMKSGLMEHLLMLHSILCWYLMNAKDVTPNAIRNNDILSQSLNTFIQSLSSFVSSDLITLDTAQSATEALQVIEETRKDFFRRLQLVRGFSPSSYAKTFYKIENNKFNGFHFNRLGRCANDPPAALILQSCAFYDLAFLIQYQHQIEPLLLQKGYDDRGKSFLKIVKATANLQAEMIQCYEKHDDRQSALLYYLEQIFPSNHIFRWEQKSRITKEGRSTIDLVYLRIKDRLPLIFVEVKIERGQGGDPFMQNVSMYGLSIAQKRFDNMREKTGGAAFFFQVTGAF